MNNILCLGDFSSGKNAFLNMLLGVSILPEKPERTNIPFVKIYSGDPAGLYLREPGEKNPRHIGNWSKIPDDWSAFEHAELTAPNHFLLEKGLVIWNSPVINSAKETHSANIEKFLKKHQDTFHSILFFISEQLLEANIKSIQRWKQFHSRMHIVVNIRKEMSEQEYRTAEMRLKSVLGVRLGTIPAALLYLMDAYAEFENLFHQKQSPLSDQVRLAMWEELNVDFGRLKKKHEGKIFGEAIFDILAKTERNNQNILPEVKTGSAIRAGKKETGTDPLGITWILVEGLERPFYIASTPVTFGQYDRFCDAAGFQKPKADFGRGKQPVIRVNVADAFAFCKWLSSETGTEVRLPEENEWEYAAKGGKKSNGYNYSGSNNLDAVAWYFNNSEGKTHDVGAKAPNELGIYDMSGNVWEWCGTSGAIRGGSWGLYASSCRVSYRLANNPDYRNSNLGFRVVQTR